jgi:cytoskeletal protein RodZ
MKRVYGDRYEEAQKAYVKELSKSSDNSESSDESKSNSESKKTSESTEKSESESNSETETESNSELETEYDEYNVPKRNLVKEELDEIKKDERSSSRITGVRTIQSRISNIGKKKKPYKVGGLFNSPKGNTVDSKLIGTRSLTNILKF